MHVAAYSLLVLACTLVLASCGLDEGHDDELGASLAAEVGDSESAAGCTPQDGAEWHWCGFGHDPTSGYSAYYVMVADGECWEAIRVVVKSREGKKYLEPKSEWISHCIEDGEEGETMEQPSGPPGDSAKSVPRLITGKAWDEKRL